MNIHKFSKFLSNPTDYEINGIIDIGIVVPEASVNLVKNPEVLTLTGFTGTASFALDSFEQAYGVNSLLVSTTLNNTVSTALDGNFDGNTSYTFSVAIKGSGIFTLSFYSAGIQIGGFTKIITSGVWQRYSHTIHLRDGILRTTPTAVITGLSATTANIDGFQVEPKPYSTTFISGTRSGRFPGKREYYWTSVPHGSASVRLASTTTGGRIVSLNSQGVKIDAIKGLGEVEVKNSSQTLAFRQRSVFNNSVYQDRKITMLMRIESNSYADYLSKRNSIVALFLQTNTKTQQPIRVIFALKSNKRPTVMQTMPVYLDVVYDGGLEGDYNTFYNEKLSLDLVSFDPVFSSLFDTSYSLTTSTSGTIVNSNTLFSNSNISGEWSDLTAVAPAGAFVIESTKIGPDGKLYALGTFVIGGIRYIAMRWDGSQWETVGPAMPIGTSNTATYDMVNVGNQIYFAGLLRGTIGTIVDNITNNGFGVVLYDILTDTISKIGEVSGPVNSIDTDGTSLFLGGQFDTITNTGGITVAAHSIAQYDITSGAWISLDTGFDLGASGNGGFFNNALNHISTVLCDNREYAWFGGQFTVGTQESITRFNTATNTWESIDALTSSTSTPTAILGPTNVKSIIKNDKGEIYAGGYFDGTTAINTAAFAQNNMSRPISIAKWSNTQWSSIGVLMTGAGVGNSPAMVFDLDYDNVNGILYTGGRINYAGPAFVGSFDSNKSVYSYNFKTNGNTIYTWNGSSWSALAIDYDSVTNVEQVASITLGAPVGIGAFSTSLSGLTNNYVLSAGLQNSIFLLVDNAQIGLTYTAPAITQCDNSYSNNANPSFTITGPGEPVLIKNVTTGDVIYFTGAVLKAGETVSIDLSGIVPDITPLTFKSKINVTSNLATFELLQDNNYIEAYIKNVGNDTSLFMTWTKKYITFDSTVEGN